MRSAVMVVAIGTPSNCFHGLTYAPMVFGQWAVSLVVSRQISKKKNKQKICWMSIFEIRMRNFERAKDTTGNIIALSITNWIKTKHFNGFVSSRIRVLAHSYVFSPFARQQTVRNWNSSNFFSGFFLFLCDSLLFMNNYVMAFKRIVLFCFSFFRLFPIRFFSHGLSFVVFGKLACSARYANPMQIWCRRIEYWNGWQIRK